MSTEAGKWVRLVGGNIEVVEVLVGHVSLLPCGRENYEVDLFEVCFALGVDANIRMPVSFVVGVEKSQKETLRCRCGIGAK